jgi:predicted SAM-dependent methyltransferase
MPRCLHLAASRFERLSPAATALLCQPGWTHLGEPPIDWSAEIREQFGFGHWIGGFRLWLASIYRRLRPRYQPEQLERQYATCEFREFHFAAGQRLDFADAEFDFIVSEHFFEHLWLPDAIALLSECQRVLKPGGVIRTCVPDADLRSYAPPEMPGYPSSRVPWSHHQKHRTRWSVFSLSEALKLCGLEARPVMWCDDRGVFHHEMPSCPGHPAAELLGTLDYFRRLPSLVVDGVRPAVG